MKKSFYITILILFPLIALSQQNKAHKIIGTIADSIDQIGIPYATMTIMKLPEKSIKKQFAAQIDGRFDISIDSVGEYLLTISALGYKITAKKFLIKSEQSINDLGSIPINTNLIELNSVTISDYKS